MATNTDVEELRKSAEALRVAQADLARMSRVTMLGETAATLAHELNQPLTAIIANCDASLRWQRSVPPNVDEMGLAVARIRRDALRASAVLERIRAFLRTAEPERAPVNMSEVIQETLDILGPELRRQQIEIYVSLRGNLPDVSGTRVELQQVLLNLITNAIESLAQLEQGKTRKLEIAARIGRVKRNEVLFIVVQDSGSGFRDGDRQRLFEPFYTTKPTGLGLGLVISRSIIRRHGGELRARSTTRGARFEFFIPCSARVPK